MPFTSQAQRRAMYAAAAGHSTVGIPQNAAKRFIAHSQESTSGLPEHAPKRKRRLKGRRKRAKRA